MSPLRGALIAGIFFGVAAFLRTQPATLALDRAAYALALELSYSRAAIVFWEAVSFFGRGGFVYALFSAALLARLFRLRDRRAAAETLFLAALFFANSALKHFFRIDRPVSLSPFSYPTTFTFPSGHAFNAVLLFFLLPALVRQAGGRFADFSVSTAAGAAGAFLIGASRVFLGVHWLSDVCAGWLLGFAVRGAALAATARDSGGGRK